MDKVDLIFGDTLYKVERWKILDKCHAMRYIEFSYLDLNDIDKQTFKEVCQYLDKDVLNITSPRIWFELVKKLDIKDLIDILNWGEWCKTNKKAKIFKSNKLQEYYEEEEGIEDSEWMEILNKKIDKSKLERGDVFVADFYRASGWGMFDGKKFVPCSDTSGHAAIPHSFVKDLYIKYPFDFWGKKFDSFDFDLLLYLDQIENTLQHLTEKFWIAKIKVLFRELVLCFGLYVEKDVIKGIRKYEIMSGSLGTPREIKEKVIYFEL